MIGVHLKESRIIRALILYIFINNVSIYLYINIICFYLHHVLDGKTVVSLNYLYKYYNRNSQWPKSLSVCSKSLNFHPDLTLMTWLIQCLKVDGIGVFQDSCLKC